MKNILPITFLVLFVLGCKEKVKDIQKYKDNIENMSKEVEKDLALKAVVDQMKTLITKLNDKELELIQEINKLNNKIIGKNSIIERKDNMIVVSGENIFPTEIEKFVNEIKKINCSLVVPVKDEITQNKLVLIYESSFKIKNEQIFNFLRKKISFFKIPKIILNCKKLDLQEIPKASNGKILRSKVINYTNNFFKKKFNETSNKKNIL